LALNRDDHRSENLIIEPPSSLIHAGERGTYTIATGVETDVLTIWRELSEIAGKQIEPELADLRPGELEHSCLQITRAERELGWRPQVPFVDGVQRAVEYYRNGVGQDRGLPAQTSYAILESV